MKIVKNTSFHSRSKNIIRALAFLPSFGMLIYAKAEEELKRSLQTDSQQSPFVVMFIDITFN